jgi:hypothetical protein
MRTRLLLVALLASACAGGGRLYVGAGTGHGATLSKAIAQAYAVDQDQAASRVFVGGGARTWAIEAQLTTIPVTNLDGTHAYATQLSSAGLGARGVLPLGRSFELYVRGGLNSTSLDDADASALSGPGIDYGTGVSVSLDLGNAFRLGAWVDLGKNRFRVHDTYEITRLDGESEMLTLGCVLGWWPSEPR